MKKIKWLLCISFIFWAVLSSGFTVKAENEYKGMRYKENDDGTITITGYTGTDEKVVIPSEIDGKDVKAIGDEAFYKCDTIKQVIISEGITDIEGNGYYGAFECCKNLETVYLPSTLKTIGNYAFYECSKLNHVDLPNGLSSIKDGAFGACSITKIVIPDSVTYIGNFETFFISHFTVVTIYANPNSYAREYADKMRGFAIEFSCINHANIITDPEVVPTCTQNGNTEGSHCADCNTIISECQVIPPKGHKFDNGIVLSAGKKTYTCTVCGATRTEKITIPSKGKTISDSSNSYKVIMPVKSGKKNATGTVEYVGTKSSKTNITIPNAVTIDGITYNVTSVANNAFKNNKKIKKVTIGSNITNIKTGAFNGCKNLKTIIIKSKDIKSVGKNVFKGVNAKAKIKVPSSELTRYKKLFEGKGQKSTVKIKK